MKVDINVDMGESFGMYTMGNDEAFMPYITTANVADTFIPALRDRMEIVRALRVRPVPAPPGEIWAAMDEKLDYRRLVEAKLVSLGGNPKAAAAAASGASR